MKLIIAGATGFVGRELVRQSLRMREITTVVALARKPVSAPEGCDAAKLKSVVIEDYGTYPEHLRKEFAGADACIWTVAITPSKSKMYGFEEVRRVCQTCALAGLGAMWEAGPAKPFRFVYMSGMNAERDQTKKPALMPEYALMRAENQILAFAAEHKGEVEACAAKPGLICDGSIVKSVRATVLSWVIGLPNISVEAAAASMLDQVVHGFETEPLSNDDMCRIGQRALQDARGKSAVTKAFQTIG